MADERGAIEARWLREGNARRYVRGLRRAWDLPLACGNVLLLIPAELAQQEREVLFEARLLAFWCARYGIPEARARLCRFTRDQGDAA